MGIMTDDHRDITNMRKKVVLMGERTMRTVQGDEEDEKLIRKVVMDLDIEKTTTSSLGEETIGI